MKNDETKQQQQGGEVGRVSPLRAVFSFSNGGAHGVTRLTVPGESGDVSPHFKFAISHPLSSILVATSERFGFKIVHVRFPFMVHRILAFALLTGCIGRRGAWPWHFRRRLRV